MSAQRHGYPRGKVVPLHPRPHRRLRPWVRDWAEGLAIVAMLVGVVFLGELLARL